MSIFNILAFDGGGIKGALSTRILVRICEKYPNFLDSVDLFAGTSTGSLISLGLATGKDVKFIDNLYSYEGTKYIFSNSRINLFKAKYSNKRLTNLLSENFPKDLKLRDLKRYVYIPAFNISGENNKGWQPIFFHNLSPNYTDSYSVIDVALASSAAPTFFPTHKQFIDGGVVASSPTTTAAFAALSKKSSIKSSLDIRILSIGTGDFPDRITRENCNWGVFQWVYNPFSKIPSPLTSILLEGSSLLDHIYCTDLFGENYFRINPLINDEIMMDDYKAVPKLKNIADELDLNDLYKFIEKRYLNKSTLYNVK